jgi:F420-dependent oxidoreductase-like protein
MRVSISISDYSWPGGPAGIGRRLGELAAAADDAGVHTIWLPDHLVQADPRSKPEAEMLETYTTLGYIAARTSRVQLGAMVTPVSYRAPAAVVKAVTTLDVLSGGRAWFGIGAGYSDAEARGMGLPFPPVAERFERLEEALRIALQMWAGDDSPFEGRHYRLERPLNSPPALRHPHPPVLVGGTGERKTLRLVAEYADIWHGFTSLETYPVKAEILARHCADVGRDPATIERSAGVQGKSLDALLAEADAFVELGVTMLTVGVNGPDYDLTQAEAVCRWRDRRQTNGN